MAKASNADENAELLCYADIISEAVLDLTNKCFYDELPCNLARADNAISLILWGRQLLRPRAASQSSQNIPSTRLKKEGCQNT